MALTLKCPSLRLAVRSESPAQPFALGQVSFALLPRADVGITHLGSRMWGVGVGHWTGNLDNLWPSLGPAPPLSPRLHLFIWKGK